MNNPPVLTVEDKIALLGTSINGTELVSAVDPDGDPIVRYRFKDTTTGNPTSGKLFLNGVEKTGRFQFAAAQLANLEFVAGTAPFEDKIEVEAFDGFQWSLISLFSIFNVTVNDDKPVISGGPSFNVVAFEKVKIADFFSYSDPDGWPADRQTR